MAMMRISYLADFQDDKYHLSKPYNTMEQTKIMGRSASVKVNR